MNTWAYLLMWLVEILLILYCIHYVFEERFRLKRTSIIIIFFDISLMLLIWMEKINIKAKIIIYILLFIYCKLNFKKSVFTTIARLAIGIMVGTFFQLVGGFFCSFWRVYIKKDVIFMTVVNVIAFMMTTFVVKFVQFRNKKEYIEFEYARWRSVIFACGVATIWIMVDYYHQGKAKTVYYIVYLGLCIFVLLRHRKNEIERLNYSKRMQEIEIKKTYADIYQELLQDVRKRQHDFKNQLSVLYSMHLTSSSIDELIEKQTKYGEILLWESRYDGILSGCNNETLAGYLYYKFREVEQKDIRVEYQIAVDKGESVFCLHEIIEIIGILITNAVESYAEKCSNKMIRMVIIEFENKIELIISNQSDYITSEEFERLLSYGYSTKGKNRGIGLARVQELCRREGADIVLNNRVKESGNWFEIAIIIPKKKR